MRPAFIAVGIALALFLLVQGFPVPLLYGVLLIPLIIFVYGLFTEDLPEVPFDDDEEDTGSAGEGTPKGNDRSAR